MIQVSRKRLETRGYVLRDQSGTMSYIFSGNDNGLAINLRRYHCSFAVKFQATREDDVAFVGILSSLIQCYLAAQVNFDEFSCVPVPHCNKPLSI